MTTLAERISLLLDEVGRSPTRMAEIAGVKPPSVSDWVNGKTKSLKSGPAIKLAKHFKVNLLWLTEGKGLMKDDISAFPDTKPTAESAEPNAEDGPLLKMQRMVPVVGEVKGGMDGYLDELEYPVGHGEGYVPSPVSDPSAYAVRVRGDSMYPRYESGEFVILSPSLLPQGGDYVVAIFTDGRKMLKKFGWQRDNEVQLLSINNGYEPISVMLSEIQAMHVVAGTAHRSSIERILESDALPSRVFSKNPGVIDQKEKEHGKSDEHSGVEKPRHRRNA